MAMSAEHSSKFAALHRLWWRLHMSEKFRVGRLTPNKQTNKQQVLVYRNRFIDINNDSKLDSFLTSKYNWGFCLFPLKKIEWNTIQVYEPNMFGIFCYIQSLLTYQNLPTPSDKEEFLNGANSVIIKYVWKVKIPYYPL